MRKSDAIVLRLARRLGSLRYLGGRPQRLVRNFPPAFPIVSGTLRRNIAKPMRILIIEDEPDLQRALAMALRDEGYAVDTAVDGEDGLFNAESISYDAIVLDVMLPKLDGWTVLQRLRKTRKTPVLMLTARDQSRDRVKGLDAGADDYVVKPFDLPELLARLRALIRRNAGQATNVIKIGDVSIDTGSRIITQRGEPVTLTAREYGLV